MTLIVPVFDSNICIYDYENYEHYDGKEQADSTIDKLFELPEVLEKENVPDAKGGRALSTVHLSDKYVIPKLLNFNQTPLGRWILQNIYESAIHFGLDQTRDVRKFKFHRTWANRMGKGCDAIAHRHAGIDWAIPHIVAIFYTEVPENSADLIFINDKNYDVMTGGHAFEYPAESQHKVESKAGRLICHDAKDLHATSIHQSELPRTCLIIEVGFPPLR